jgi:hypothetical protein
MIKRVCINLLSSRKLQYRNIGARYGQAGYDKIEDLDIRSGNCRYSFSARCKLTRHLRNCPSRDTSISSILSVAVMSFTGRDQVCKYTRSTPIGVRTARDLI